MVYAAAVSTCFVHTTLVIPARGPGQDRAAVREADERIVIVLADGAGGTGAGGEAAQAIVDGVLAATTDDWSQLLVQLDRDLARLGGQSTAVVLSLGGTGIGGASVGDSGAWLIRDGDVEDLTADKQRKPLVGGGCRPVAVRAGALAGGTLLVASDGLLKYAKRADVIRICGGDDLADIARTLIDLVRLPSGKLQDDVAIVLCREARLRLKAVPDQMVNRGSPRRGDSSSDLRPRRPSRAGLRRSAAL